MASTIKRCGNAQIPSDQISSSTSAAAEIICGNNDLVSEILQRLPPKSLIRFKSVSKTWLSLISSHTFSLLWQRYRQSHHPKISGFFLTCTFRTEIDYIPLTDIDDGQNRSLARFPNMFFQCNNRTTIMHSCNGFLLCCLTKLLLRSFHVYNPTTEQFSTLPWPFSFNHFLLLDPLYLAFDPLKSHHYKVVLLQRLHKNQVGDDLYQIHIYSSETNAWRPFGADLLSETAMDFKNGVYCNGSIHWISFGAEEASIYFDVDQERLCSMPSSPIWKAPSRYLHFGESRGRLHLAGPNINHDLIFNVHVYEMERDYSKWSLKYRVDLNTIACFLSPEIIDHYAVCTLSLIREEDEGDDVHLVLFIGTTVIISYNIKDNTFKKLHDVAPYRGSSSREVLALNSGRVYPYIETVFSV
ncbi:F-box protein At5g07610-like [Cornus florida]|uniref:F-box protein At5g07610-like n=1 Tax=Cornus florida TaxID=4283 RepID=UPI0028A003F6|nr:F-box protein At5g07610-like [Cornus florida]